MRIRKLSFLFFLSAILLICGCSQGAPDAGFVPNPELMKKDSKLPFDAAWYKQGEDLRTYKKIYVAPVDTTHLLKMSWWEKFNAANEFIKPQDEVNLLAKYFQEQTINAFKKEEKHGYQVVDQPDEQTLIIELALVEVIPVKIFLNTIGYIAVGALDTGETAIEGRFRDGGSKEIIFRFKDQRMGKMDIVSIADLEWYAHSKHTLEEWASDLVDVCDKAPDESLSSRIPFTLKPW